VLPPTCVFAAIGYSFRVLFMGTSRDTFNLTGEASEAREGAVKAFRGQALSGAERGGCQGLQSTCRSSIMIQLFIHIDCITQTH
jgi:hypothetical protein